MEKQSTSAEIMQFASAGRAMLAAALPEGILHPVRACAEALRQAPPHQDLLSGVHNPFGYHACIERAWSLLDITESDELLNCVEAALGPDIILWDSELYFDLSALWLEEGSIWPAEPLAGAIAAIALESGDVLLLDIARLHEQREVVRRCQGTYYVVRYMPATSLFDRDASSQANRRATELRPLVNYAKRPLWLVRGNDRRGNDFSSGFSLPAARWVEGGALRDHTTSGATVKAEGA